MRRSILAIVLAAGTTLTLASPAGAATSTTTRAAAPSVAHEASDRKVASLECRVVRHDGRPAVGCNWRQAPERVAGYRLMRVSRAGRTVLLRTDDLSVTRHLDDTVEPGKAYGYVLQLLGPDGRVVGQSRLQLVRVPAPAAS